MAAVEWRLPSDAMDEGAGTSVVPSELSPLDRSRLVGGACEGICDGAFGIANPAPLDPLLGFVR